jgi:phosphoribosylformimino-5-aminoimidazole carboxamide ribotide isomerase
VAGLETLTAPVALERLCDDLGEAVVFSLDLRAGRPLGELSAWETHDPRAIALRAVATGVGAVLVLDLTRVGMGQGTGTEELRSAIRAAAPGVRILAGGGIRCLEDLRQLRQQGVDMALVASALHDGSLSPADLEQLS